MANTLTIRLEEGDRRVLEQAARQQGIGLSAFLRDLAEAEARRLRREAIRQNGLRVVEHLHHDAEARAELDTYGTPIGDLP